MNKEKLGTIGLLSVTILWGGGFIATDISLLTFNPFQVMAIRFTLSLFLFLPFSIRKLKKLNSKSIIFGLIMGVALFSSFLFQTIGLKYSTPSKNAFLTATNIVFVPFIIYFILKKKPKGNEVVAVILAVLGSGLISLNDNFSIGYGELLTMIGAISFAFHIFFTGEFAKEEDALVLNFFQMLLAAILSLISLLFTNSYSEFNGLNINSYLSIGYLAIISTTLNYFLQTYSQKYVSQMRASIILSLEGVFATILSILILHEQLSLRGAIGSIVILLAVFVAIRKEKIKEP